MKKTLSMFLAILCCCMLFVLPVSAADSLPSTYTSTTRIELEDGGYIIEEVTSTAETVRTTTSKSGTKTSTRYDADGNKLYAVKVTGSFKYTGSTSWSTSSSATVSIYDSDVTYVSKSSSYSSNYATATGKITYLLAPESRTVTLYCDKNGTLS